MKSSVALTCILGLLVLGFSRQASSDPGHPGGSVNVALIPGSSIPTGGILPTAGGDFNDFTFTNLPVNMVDAANLAAFDTAVLNMTAAGCDTTVFTASQKTDINNFVAGGGKLIIYDSECTFNGSVDYTWLTFPFMTDNPGALGAFGIALTVSEENALSTSMLADPHYIDTAAINSQTDAVGDMNVVDLVTVDPHWCLDLVGTNALMFSGAVHMYARSGTGLYIYNGLDMDAIATAVGPSGGGQMAKLWLQELQTGKSSIDLPCGISVAGIALSPDMAVNDVGTMHTVTALVTDLGTPLPGVLVTFTVLSGPNASASGTCTPNADCTTDANGEVSFTYTGSGGVGIDQIQACFTNGLGAVVCSAIVEKEWITPQECFLVIGDGKGTAQWDAGLHEWQTQISQVTESYAVLIDDIPSFPVPQALTSSNARYLVDHFTAQVLMYNPEVFPSNPEQYTNGLEVWVWSDGRVMASRYGTRDNMSVRVQTYTDASGQKLYRLPFRIGGL